MQIWQHRINPSSAQLWLKQVGSRLASLIPCLLCLLLLSACGGSTSEPSVVPPTRTPTISPSLSPDAELICQLDRQSVTFTDTLYTQRPDASTCNPGQLSPPAARFLMDRLNFLRSLHGLSPVALNLTFLDQAQQAALMLVANDALSHDPPSSWRCFTAEGLQGCKSSNLAIGSILGFGNSPENSLLARQVDIYFTEPGESNYADVGHRRWNLLPQYAEGAFAVVSDLDDPGFNQANANWVFEFDPSRPDPEFIAFPAQDGYLYRLSGFSPQPISEYRWSFSVKAGSSPVDFSATQIRITDDQTGEPVNVQDIRIARPGFGWDTVTYSVGEVLPNRIYRFEISNVGRDGINHVYTYSTSLIDCGSEATDLRQTIPEFGSGSDTPPAL